MTLESYELSFVKDIWAEEGNCTINSVTTGASFLFLHVTSVEDSNPELSRHKKEKQ